MTFDNKQEYRWDDDFSGPLRRVDIKTVVAELEQIERERGTVTPFHLVEAAKNPKSVLHTYFQWDNAQAAHLYRLQQARVLLGGIKVKTISNGEVRRMNVSSVVKKSVRPSSAFDENPVVMVPVSTETNTDALIIKCLSHLYDAMKVISSNADHFEVEVFMLHTLINTLSGKKSTETNTVSEEKLTSVA